jgi:hypothetical protein
MPNALFPFWEGIFHPADEGGVKGENRGGFAQFILWRPLPTPTASNRTLRSRRS